MGDRKESKEREKNWAEEEDCVEEEKTQEHIQNKRCELATSRFGLKIRSKPNYQSSERPELPSTSPIDQNYHFQDGGLTADERPYMECAAIRPVALSWSVFLQEPCACGYPVYSLEVRIKWP